MSAKEPRETGDREPDWKLAIIGIVIALLMFAVIAPTIMQGFNVPPINNTTSLRAAPPVARAYTTYEAQFVTSGLPSGTQWGVFWNGAGTATLTTSSSLNFTGLTAGTSYPWSAASVSGYAVSPTSGTITIPTLGGNVQQTLTYTAKPAQTYTMYFNETGLLGGTTWKITIAGTLYSTTSASVSVTEPNGTYAFNVSHIAGYYAPSPQYGNVTINGAGISTTITFSLVYYTVSFTESGLPSGTEWYVNVSGQTSMSGLTATLSRSLLNGSYDFTIATINKLYEPDTYNPAFTVNGQAVSIFVQFSKTLYYATFSEVGLPSGTQWEVTLNGTRLSSTLSSMSFSVSNGTYKFTVENLTSFLPTPYNGSVTVNGAGVNIPITFKTNLTITFVETGLAKGKVWFVTFNGTQKSSSTTTIGFYISTIGVYSFTIGKLSYWSISPSNGTINVTQNESVAIDFNRIYALTFIASGLPSGTAWTVNYGGTIYSATTGSGGAGTEINVTVPQGNVLMYVYANGYYSNPSTYNSYVGNNQTVKVTFTPAASSPFNVFANGDLMIFIIIFAGVLAVVVILLLRRRD